MSKKSRWFLGFACAAMIVSLSRVFPAVAVSDGVGSFATGLAAALMVGVLVTWKPRRSAES